MQHLIIAYIPIFKTERTLCIGFAGQKIKLRLKEETCNSYKNLKNFSVHIPLLLLSNEVYMSVFTNIQKIFLDQIILILSESLASNSNGISIQNYESNGLLFIPVFTSPEKLKESLQGHKLENEVISINGSYFCSLLLGNEIIIVNPDLTDEIRTNANELTELMKEQILRERNI